MGGHRLQGDAKTVYVITAMEATKTLLGNDPALGIPIGMLSHLPAMIVQWNGAYYAIFLANPGAGNGHAVGWYRHPEADRVTFGSGLEDEAGGGRERTAGGPGRRSKERCRAPL